jgi:hypothetical protein
VFSLVRGVLELPGMALSGIVSLFTSDDKTDSVKKTRNMPSTAPVAPAPVRKTGKQRP